MDSLFAILQSCFCRRKCNPLTETKSAILSFSMQIALCSRKCIPVSADRAAIPSLKERCIPLIEKKKKSAILSPKLEERAKQRPCFPAGKLPCQRVPLHTQAYPEQVPKRMTYSFKLKGAVRRHNEPCSCKTPSSNSGNLVRARERVSNVCIPNSACLAFAGAFKATQASRRLTLEGI
jgi:hypothetical protein